MTYMFLGAESFNGNLNSWDVTRVEEMEEMFSDAISFNQDLCGWSTTFDYSACYCSMFTNTDCETEDEPDQSDGGPFCAVCP